MITTQYINELSQIHLTYVKVYRGPDKAYEGKGYQDGAFAPWGFYVTQPEDNKAYVY